MPQVEGKFFFLEMAKATAQAFAGFAMVRFLMHVHFPSLIDPVQAMRGRVLAAGCPRILRRFVLGQACLPRHLDAARALSVPSAIRLTARLS